MEEIIVNDRPGNVCFGCSPHNAQGLRMTFVVLAPATRAEARWRQIRRC